MEPGIYRRRHFGTPLDLVLNSIRCRLAQCRLASGVRQLRLAVHFGPWRGLARLLIRRLRPVASRLDSHSVSLLPGLLEGNNAEAIAAAIHRDSVWVAGVLREDAVSRLRRITDQLPVDHYQLMHLIDDEVRELAEDPGILAVLRGYFGCEPALLESTLMVTGSHDPATPCSQNVFHFDYAGWQSLNVFLYLSDVEAGSSAHIVARGSHRHIGLSDIMRGSLGEEEARQRFGEAIATITGPAGTLFFENTEAFHRRHAGQDRRVMLNLLYASHRGLFSRGRAGPQHLERRAQIYGQLRRCTKEDGLQRAQPVD